MVNTNTGFDNRQAARHEASADRGQKGRSLPAPNKLSIIRLQEPA